MQSDIAETLARCLQVPGVGAVGYYHQQMECYTYSSAANVLCNAVKAHVHANYGDTTWLPTWCLVVTAHYIPWALFAPDEIQVRFFSAGAICSRCVRPGTSRDASGFQIQHPGLNSREQCVSDQTRCLCNTFPTEFFFSTSG